MSTITATGSEGGHHSSGEFSFKSFLSTYVFSLDNASPIGDTPPLLIALNAKIKLRCGDESRTMPIEDYFISYKVTAQKESEFIEQIIIPKTSNDSFRAYKLSKRLDDDISAVCGAFLLSTYTQSKSKASSMYLLITSSALQFF